MFAGVVEVVGGASDGDLLVRLREVENRRRADAAEEAVLLAELDRRKVFRRDGHATMWGLLRSMVGWSDRECRERMRIARLVAAFSDAGEMLHEQVAPVASIAEVARGFANPRCGTEIEAVLGTLLNEATRLEYDDITTLVRRWEDHADTDGAHRATAAGHDHRNAHVVVAGGVGYAQGQWGEIEGIANKEIFDHFVTAEWRADWDHTRELHGDAACTALMPRTDAQRRADALTRIFNAAAAAHPGATPPEPVVDLHVDHHTFTDVMIEFGLFPERTRTPFDHDGEPLITDRRCETGHGDPIDPHTMVQLALQHYVRIVIHDDEGIPIHHGRRRRLFQGAARRAVMSLSPRCTHPGCRVRARRTQADHTVDHAHGGPTNPDNGNPRCLRHNLLKNHGYTVHRDPHGRWHTHRPDGTEIPDI